MASSNVPLGSDNDKKAPWNEKANTNTKTFQCGVSMVVSKVVNIPTLEYDEVEEKNEDGYTDIDYIPHDDIDWEVEYQNNCITLKDMLQELKTYVKQDLAMTGRNTSKGKYLERLLKECQGWTITDIEIDGRFR